MKRGKRDDLRQGKFLAHNGRNNGLKQLFQLATILRIFCGQLLFEEYSLIKT